MQFKMFFFSWHIYKHKINEIWKFETGILKTADAQTLHKWADRQFRADSEWC